MDSVDLPQKQTDEAQQEAPKDPEQAFFESHEDEAAESFYKVLEEIDNIRQMYEDPNTPAEQKTGLASLIKKLEEDLDSYDANNKFYHDMAIRMRDRAKGSSTIKAAEVQATGGKIQTAERPPKLYIGTDGTVWKTAKEAREGAVE